MAIAERWAGHPPLPEDLESRLADVVERLRGAGADLIYLFGSAATSPEERDRPAGDLDLAVRGLKEDISRARADLAEILGTDRLDLVRLERAAPELRYHVVARGRLLHSEDRRSENDFELGVLREFRDLEPFRRIRMRYLRARHGASGP